TAEGAAHRAGRPPLEVQRAAADRRRGVQQDCAGAPDADPGQRAADRGARSESRFALTQRATTSTATGITIPSERIIAATRPTKFRHACLNASPRTLEPACPTTGSGSCT